MFPGHLFSTSVSGCLAYSERSYYLLYLCLIHKNNWKKEKVV